MTSDDINNLCQTIREAFGDNEFNINVPEAIMDSLRRDDGDGYTHIVTVVESLSDNAKRIADAITPSDASPGPCPSGDGQVGSLTEAVMGLTRAMTQIASAIEEVATAITLKD